MADVMGWQDISTAPRDGTEFLGYDVRTGKMDVCNFDRWGDPQAVQSDCEYGPSEDDFGFDHRDIKFWMPLPTPPSPSQTPT